VLWGTVDYDRSENQGLTGANTLSDEVPLLGQDDPPPFCVIEVEPSRPVLLVCDHASNNIPSRLNGLGVSASGLATHLGHDIGAANVTRYLSAVLKLPAVMAGYSRLAVDCNRRLDDPSAFTVGDEGTVVSGNLALTHPEREMRANALYWPYHHAVRDQLAALESMAEAPALVTIHSFTPVLNGSARPWHIGILWDSDPRIPEALITALRNISGVLVGDNEPYSGKDPHDFTIDHHGEAEGLPHVSIEIRQDLIDTDAGVEKWGGRLAEALTPILDDPALYTFWTS
jgi:predicted N-formylglutamate amidohydrolase